MIKKIIICVLVLFFCCNITWANDDIQSLPEQLIENNQSYATLNLQKQPQEGKQKQKINNHFTFFTINIQINGKIKDDNKE